MSDEYDDYAKPSRSFEHAVVGMSIGALFLAAIIVALLVASRKAKDQPREALPAAKARVERVDSGDISVPGMKTIMTVWTVAIIVAVVWFLLSVCMAIWAIKDARNRSIDAGALWGFAIVWFGPIGLLIYLASRPAGTLIPCDHCGNRRLEFVTVCPHCRSKTGKKMRISGHI